MTLVKTIRQFAKNQAKAGQDNLREAGQYNRRITIESLGQHCSLIIHKYS